MEDASPMIKMSVVCDRTHALPRFMFEFTSALSTFRFIMPDGLPAAEWTALAESAREQTDYAARWGDDIGISIADDRARFTCSGEAGNPFQSQFVVVASSCVPLFARAAEETARWC